MPDQDDTQTQPKKSSKKARKPGKTSGELRAAAAKAEKKAKADEKPAKPADKRLYTCEQWARGRVDPVTRAFVSEHARKRTVKRTPAAWMAAYRDWLKQPRG
jgi:hypothetical protein